MDLEEYRSRYVVDPPPEPRADFVDRFSLALYFEDYEPAVAFYTEVLGPPGYSEGSGTRSWAIGNGWLTLLDGGEGSPGNVEVMLEVATPAEADRLHAAFVAAGGTGAEPTDAIMFDRVRFCAVTDPFGTDLVVFARHDAD